ncbi:hssA/2C/7E family protein [Dictyostelium discoideum AX4]|uniref:HssA/B-like protein 62 n=1 Tax=Dictyostelium discoideum TaxID=44689 RepID=HSL62_DICDI|nr:hssA/2C/7E family protein [Dictyostelium discoideum AX4]Q54BX6.1 RecName: Full=HssA/B-like protein 62 [Dictyostelium discoideum]EAL60767.1 hssA/2C/7E family protein [Dictyostelium discoideum AX4]|eukprot:XP_629180.1 hssA/2C/7E family protein [Dictyostelium discoideum AX4]
MTILSAITSISRPNKISKSVVSSNGGASLSMGSNSVACGGCGGGSSVLIAAGGSGGLFVGAAVAVDLSIHASVGIAIGSTSCHCN